MAVFKNKKVIGSAIFVICLLLAVSGSFFFYQKAYANKIFRNVSVADINLSGLSKKQATYLLQKHFNQILDREITLKAGGKEVKTRLKDTGVDFDLNQIVDTSFQVGRSSNMLDNIIGTSQTLWQVKEINATPKINQAAYEGFVNLTLPQLNSDAENASLKIENGKIVEVKEVAGQSAVIVTNMPGKLIKLANNPSKNVLVLEAKSVTPDAELKDFAEAKQFAEKVLASQLTLTYQNFAFQPNTADLGRWVSFSNNNGKLIGSIDDSSIKTYLNGIAANFEVQKINQKVNALDNSIIVAGQPGTYLDKDKTLSAIKVALGAGSEASILLETYVQQPDIENVIPAEGLTAGRFEGKYIDVDLTQQKLCTIEGQNIVKCYIISSGKPSTPTPVGTRIIDSKEERRWSGEFGLWMPWWESMGGGYGIHELPEWPSGYKEGQAHLGTPVSHGCVRLGIGDAKEVYDWTEIGTPVYIHK